MKSEDSKKQEYQPPELSQVLVSFAAFILVGTIFVIIANDFVLSETGVKNAPTQVEEEIANNQNLLKTDRSTQPVRIIEKLELQPMFDREEFRGIPNSEQALQKETNSFVNSSRKKSHKNNFDHFQKYLGITSARSCEIFERLDFKVTKWQENAVNRKRWECFAEISGVQDKQKYSIFIIIAGKQDGAANLIRFRVIRPDDSKSKKIDKLFHAAYDELIAYLKWKTPEAMNVKIKNFEPFETEYFGVKVSYFSDFENDRILNLKLDFPSSL